jgi:hypothetical protein
VMVRRFNLLHWLVDHASWEVILAFAKAYIWPIVGTGIIAIGLAARNRLPSWLWWGCICVAVLCVTSILPSAISKLSRGGPQLLKVGDIRFDYLPQSPLMHGWKLAYEDPGPPPSFRSATDAPNQDGLAIKVDRKYAIYYELPPNAGICDRIRFAARFTSSTMFFTRVDVISRDRSHPETVDLKFYVGKRNPIPTPGWPKEWTLWVTGETLAAGWMSFEISLPDVVRRTFGTHGLMYDRLRGIRLRGSLSISPIELLREKGPTEASEPLPHRLKSAIPLLVVMTFALALIFTKVNNWDRLRNQQQKAGDQSNAPQSTNKGAEDDGSLAVSGTAKQLLSDEPRTALEHEKQTKKILRARDEAVSRLREFDKNMSDPQQRSPTGGATATGTATLTVKGPQLDVRERAFSASAGILNFLLERERSAPPYPSADLSPTDWSKAEAEIRAYDAETMRLFNQAWGAQVIDLRDRLAAKGLQDPALDDLYNRPTSPLGIRIIGEKIGGLAEKLPSEPPAK